MNPAKSVRCADLPSLGKALAVLPAQRQNRGISVFLLDSATLVAMTTV